MSVNAMSFEQAATVLNSLYQQATGEIGITPTNLSDYISVGLKTLQAGYDPLAMGISQMVSRTIYSIRNYESKLSVLQRSNEEYGAIVRKITPLAQDFIDDDVWHANSPIPNPFAARLPQLWQSNFYGFDVWESDVAITRAALKNAVMDPGEMGRLLDLVLGNKSNELEQGRETWERATLANLIGAIYAMNNTNQVRHLLTEYNAETGITPPLTSTTVYDPANYPGFIKWAYAQIGRASDLLTERTSAFHLNPTSSTILRHTPKRDQLIFVWSKILHDMDARVLSDTFNTDMVTNEVKPYTASLNFWQSLNTPDTVSVTPAYIDGSGAQVTATAQVVSDVFAVICDRDALGTHYHDQSVDSIWDPRQKRYNYWYHEARRYWCDVTENAILFLLD